MLEIVAVILLTKKVGEIVEAKGYKKGLYQLLTVGLWFGGEIAGVVLGLSAGGGSESGQCAVYAFGLAGAAIGGTVAFLVARGLAPAAPQSKDTNQADPHADVPQVDPHADMPPADQQPAAIGGVAETGAGCPSCGRQNETDARFCIFCGAPITPAEEPSPDAPSEPDLEEVFAADVASSQARTGSSNVLKVVAVIAGACLMLLVTVGVAVPLYTAVRQRAASSAQQPQQPEEAREQSPSNGQEGALPPGHPSSPTEQPGSPDPPITEKTPYFIVGALRGAVLDGVESPRPGYDAMAVTIATNNQKLIDAVRDKKGLDEVQLMHGTSAAPMTDLVGTAMVAKDAGTRASGSGTSRKLTFYFSVPKSMKFVENEFIIVPFDFGGWAIGTIEYR